MIKRGSELQRWKSSFHVASVFPATAPISMTVGVVPIDVFTSLSTPS